MSLTNKQLIEEKKQEVKPPSDFQKVVRDRVHEIEVGNVITYDARTKIPTDRAGIGFPWRNPISTLINVFVPKSLRLLVKDHVDTLKAKVLKSIGKK